MEKYEPLGVVGEGSYGVVLKCRHIQSGRSVAIKKFIDSEDDQNVRKIALREIRVLRKLRHENLVNLLEVFRRRKHLYLVFEFIDHTLLDELESKSKGLEGEVCRKYVYQILRGLGFCHDNNIIHRDVKPENVLVSKNGIVKLCDFGFARNLCGPGEQYTDYVATRWYRAPELLVGDVVYGKEVDIWAVGCLFSEMMSGEALFPGDSDIDQLFLIAQCLGRLARRHLSIMSKNSAFRGFQFPPMSRHGSTASTDSGGQLTNHHKLAKLDSGGNNRNKGESGQNDSSGSKSRMREEKSVFAAMFPLWSHGQIDFLTLCLDPEPSGRPSCNALLRLSYFTHDNFPSRFINEFNQKLQLEGRHPIPAYSTRKKRSILGSLQQGQGANVSSMSPANYGGSLKKNPVYQTRLNLADNDSSLQNNNSMTTPTPVNTNTKYSDTFPTSNVQRHPPLINRQNDQNKFGLTRDQTFVVGKLETNNKSFLRKDLNTTPTKETKIPSLLNRKYSDDSLIKNGFSSGSGSFVISQGSKSTPNIVSGDNENSTSSNGSHLPLSKRYSIQNSNLLNGATTVTPTSQPRKFSYSFPPPDTREKEQDENNIGSSTTKLFQPLPVTTLTFSLGQHSNGGIGYPYPQISKSPNSNSYLNVSSYSNLQLKRTPSPKSTKGTNENSSYFPHTHFSTNQNQQIRYPVSFYQSSQVSNSKSLPVSVFGSSMILKNQFDSGTGATGESSFLPRMMAGKKADEVNNSLLSSSNFLKPLPKRRDSQSQLLVKSGQGTQNNNMPRGVSKHTNGTEAALVVTPSSNGTGRHFSISSTYGE